MSKYITPAKAKKLSGGKNNLNFTMWELVDGHGNMVETLRPGVWLVIKNYYTPTIFLKVTEDLGFEEYEMREEAYEGGDQPCKHGHIACASWEGGPCADEVAAKMEQEDKK